MDKTSLYVKKIFIFLLVSIGTLLAFRFCTFRWPFLSEYEVALGLIIFPISFLSIAVLHYGFSGRKPPYLFVLDKSDAFINGKNGFWMFLKPLLLLVGFVYDIVVWIIWGVYLVYEFILDIVQLIKTILYWLFHALLWFLKLFVPPIKLLYYWFLHYVIRWPWWLYKLSFVNIHKAFKRNYYFVSVWGSVIALAVIFLFYYIAVITDVIGLASIGVILSILPLSWSFGEISFIKKEKLEKKPYWEVRNRFANGMEAVRNVLIYLLILLTLSIAQIALDLLGWIPSIGYTFLGVVFNINSAISFVIIVLAFIIFFAATILPTNLLFGGKSQPDFLEMLSQLGIIVRKFFRVVFVNVPASIFGSFVLFLPALMFVLTIGLTIQVKNKVLDTKINSLKTKREFVTGMDAQYKLGKDIEKLEQYKEFPFITFQSFLSLGELKNRIAYNQNQLGASMKEMELLNDQYNLQKDNLSQKIDQVLQIPNTDERRLRSAEYETIKEQMDASYAKKKMALNRKRMEAGYNIDYLSNYRSQTYIVFFFVGIWFAIFVGIVLAFYVSYMGNVYYDLYHFREDGKPVYLMQKVYEENEKDKKQPLLGFSLLIIVLAILTFLFFAYQISEALMSALN